MMRIRDDNLSTICSILHQVRFHYLLAYLPFYTYLCLNRAEQPRVQVKFPRKTEIPSPNTLIAPPKDTDITKSYSKNVASKSKTTMLGERTEGGGFRPVTRSLNTHPHSSTVCKQAF